MSGKTASQVRNATKPILTRVTNIETDLNNLVVALNKSLTLVENRLQSLEEVSNAVVGILGQEEIQKRITAAHVKAAEAQVAVQDKALQMAVEKGLVVKAEAITEKSVIVGREFDKDGVVVAPGRVQMLYGQVKDEFKAGLLGQAVGAQIDTPVGGKFEVLEVYEIQDSPASIGTVAVAPTVQEVVTEVVDALGEVAEAITPPKDVDAELQQDLEAAKTDVQ